MENNSDAVIYLVTGAAGFLGSTVVRKLVCQGKRVRALVMPKDPSWKYLPSQTEVVFGDLTDLRSLDEFFTVPDGFTSVCLHIASIVTVNPSYSQKVMDVNVGGTKNIIHEVLSHPECRKLVYCSSTGAIPELPKGTPIREIRHFTPEGLQDCYSQSKALATQAVLDAVHEEDLNACVVHPSGILGPEDYAIGTTTGSLIRIINGEMTAGIDGSFNLCDVRDLADGVIAAVEKGRKGECYILANKEVSFHDFADMIADEAGVKHMKIFIPGKLAYLIAGISEKKAAKTGKQPLMTTFAVWNLMRNNTYDSSKAERELGYHARPYQETIHDEVAWLLEQGLVHAGQKADVHAMAH